MLGGKVLCWQQINANYEDEHFFLSISSCHVMNNVCPACTPGFVGAGRKGFVLAEEVSADYEDEIFFYK